MASARLSLQATTSIRVEITARYLYVRNEKIVYLRLCHVASEVLEIHCREKRNLVTFPKLSHNEGFNSTNSHFRNGWKVVTPSITDFSFLYRFLCNLTSSFQWYHHFGARPHIYGEKLSGEKERGKTAKIFMQLWRSHPLTYFDEFFFVPKKIKIPRMSRETFPKFGT